MRKAFTLIEILVVVAIVAVLAGLLYPLVARAKVEGKRATTISNLRQCGLALAMYCGDGDARDLPLLSNAKSALAKAPTCDPADDWRAYCTSPSLRPMIGSYAYVRGTDAYTDEGNWIEYLKSHENPTILGSIFSATWRSRPFEGDLPDIRAAGYNPHDYSYPDRAVRLFLDGSVKTTTHWVWRGNLHANLAWPQFFNDEGGKR